MDSIRVAIVGNNLYGRVYSKAVEANPGASLVAICSELGETLEPFASEHQLRAYPDLATLLKNEEPDAVLLASVTKQHAEQAIQAFKAGAHVMTDRPIAMNLTECDLMIAEAEALGRILMVGHVLQFWPEYMLAREIIQKGELGQILLVTASRVSGTLNLAWQQRLLNSNYGLGGLEAHVHDVEFLCSLFGLPESVVAHGVQIVGGAWAQAHSLLQFPGGVLAGMEADYRVPLNFPLSMYLRVDGEKGALVFTFRGALAARQSAQRSTVIFKNGMDAQELEMTPSDAYTAMLGHFFNCIRENIQPTWGSPYQARQALEVLLAIEQSAGERKIVHFYPDLREQEQNVR
jgi:predicted dehydrogenase